MIAQAHGRHGRALLPLAVCMLLGGRPAAAEQPASPERLAMARQALAAGDAAAAEATFREVTAAEPGNLPAWGGLGEALAAQGRTAEAAAVLARVTGEVIAAGRWDLALRFLDEHLRLLPGNATLEALAGRAAMLAQQAERAHQHLTRAVALGASDAHTLLLLAAARWELGDVAGAEQLYRQLAARTAAPPVVMQRLGALLLWQGRFAEAAEVLGAAVRASPAAVELRYDLARALVGAGRDAEALPALRRLVAEAPRHTAVRYQLATVLARRGRRDEAAREMATYRELYAAEQEAVRRQGLERARLDQGWHLLDGGRARDALALFDGLPETAESLAGEAAARAALGEHAAAVAALERAVALAPERGDLRLLLAEHRQRLRDGG